MNVTLGTHPKFVFAFAGSPINIGSGEEVSILQLAKMIKNIVSNNGNISKIVFSQNYILFIYLIKLLVGNLPVYSFAVENKSEISDQRMEISE